LVEALCYKLKDRRFESQMRWIFSIYLSFQPHYGPEVDQPLTEMSTRNLPGGKKRPARRADKIAAICEPNV
jgi:hypothetical protein